MKSKLTRSTAASIFTGPALALIVFIVGVLVDPLNVGSINANVALVSFFFSVVALLATQAIFTQLEVGKATDESRHTYDAVRTYIDVIKLGTPTYAWEYIMKQLPRLDAVQNTSFNYESEIERTEERLYEKDSYRKAPTQIAHYVKKGLSWKDLGDEGALLRFHAFQQAIPSGSKGRYEYRRIANMYPQIGFIILTYKGGANEVLFNWDFHQQNIAQDPKVLLSRNDDIVNMFASHYQNLWDQASPGDYDSSAVKSTS